MQSPQVHAALARELQDSERTRVQLVQFSRRYPDMTIEDSYAIQTSRVRVNGKQQVFVPIYRQTGASSLAVADGVKAAIPDLEAELPEGSKLEFVIDQSDYVRKAIEGLIHEGIIGAILVSLMILVFLGNWKMTVIAPRPVIGQSVSTTPPRTPTYHS